MTLALSIDGVLVAEFQKVLPDQNKWMTRYAGGEVAAWKNEVQELFDDMEYTGKSHVGDPF